MVLKNIDRNVYIVGIYLDAFWNERKL